MHIEKFTGKPRRYKNPYAPRYKTPNFRQKHMKAVSVDAKGRIYLFSKLANAVVVGERFHFFEEVLDADDWKRVREFYNLPERMRHSNKSHGVRRGEGRQVGLVPKKPIHIIQEERGKEAGERSWRVPTFTKAELREMSDNDSDFDFFPDEPDDKPPF